MRPRDPRRLLARRERVRARVELTEPPQSSQSPEGGVTSRQVAEVELPRTELDRIWSPEYLERLAATYWRFLSRVSLGLLRVLYTESSREIVVLRRPFVLLRFFAPEYETAADFGSVTWRIDKGVLVARRGRGKGFLRISVKRHRAAEGDGSRDARVTVTSEVANFYPTIAGWGWALYRATQLRIHVVVTNAFLRSLAALDLAPSVVGAFRTEQVEPPPQPATTRR